MFRQSPRRQRTAGGPVRHPRRTDRPYVRPRAVAGQQPGRNRLRSLAAPHRQPDPAGPDRADGSGHHHLRHRRRPDRREVLLLRHPGHRPDRGTFLQGGVCPVQPCISRQRPCHYHRREQGDRLQHRHPLPLLQPHPALRCPVRAVLEHGRRALAGGEPSGRPRNDGGLGKSAPSPSECRSGERETMHGSCLPDFLHRYLVQRTGHPAAGDGPAADYVDVDRDRCFRRGDRPRNHLESKRAEFPRLVCGSRSRPGGFPSPPSFRRSDHRPAARCPG